MSDSSRITPKLRTDAMGLIMVSPIQRDGNWGRERNFEKKTMNSVLEGLSLSIL